jgi:hypothetical protein
MKASQAPAQCRGMTHDIPGFSWSSLLQKWHFAHPLFSKARYCQMLCIGDGRILVEMIDLVI